MKGSPVIPPAPCFAGCMGVKSNFLAAADYGGVAAAASANGCVESYTVRKYTGTGSYVELMKFTAWDDNYFH